MRVCLQNSSVLCKPAPARFPFSDHRSMAQVMYDEYKRRPRSQRWLSYDEWVML